MKFSALVMAVAATTTSEGMNAQMQLVEKALAMGGSAEGAKLLL